MAVQRFTWTRESAIEYLASSAFHPAKPLTQYSTSELKRKASQYKRAEVEQREAPTTEETRGHARIRHMKAEGKHLERWQVDRKKRDINQADLKEMYNRAGKSKGTSENQEVMVYIKGVNNYTPVRGSVPENRVVPVTLSTDMATLKDDIANFTDIIQWANDLWFGEIKWERIDSVAFVFPNE